MELIYSMRRKPLKCEPPYFESISDPDVTRPICTISVANIIAFSSPTELSDSDGRTWGGHVYVCDLDTPWDSHKVTSTTHPVSALEWDSEGKQLVVGTTVGDLSVYVQKEYLLNEWTCSYSVNFPGEHIVKASFFNNGRRVVMTDKKPEVLIQDKVQVVRSSPTLKGFGGVAQPGVCIVGASGIVGAIVDCTSTEPTTLSEPLTQHSDRVTAAAIATTHSGAIVIASVMRSRIRCVSCTVTPSRVCVTPLPAVCLPREYGLPASISWCFRDEADTLLVTGDTVSMWKLTERAYPVHKLLTKGQGSSTPPASNKSDCFSSLSWQQAGSWSLERSVACAARHACLVATQRAVHLLQPRGQVLSTAVLTSGGGEKLASTPPKKIKYEHGVLPSGSSTATVCCIQSSALGGVLVLLDTHSQLHVYKLLNHLPTAANNSLREACSLIEYSLVSGIDCLDVLLTLSHSHIEALYDRITESFQRQPPPFQQFYYQSWITLRCNLLRVHPGEQWSLSSLVSAQGVWAVWASCVAALRADDLDDNTLADEKSLLSLESRSESAACSAEATCLRRALRRVAHTARALLANIHPHLHHKYELHTDGSIVSVLRRLVLLCRPAADTLLRPLARLHAAPAAPSADMLVSELLCRPAADTLLRPLARLHAAPAAPSADMLEEFAVITAQMIAPRIWESLPRCSVSSPHERSWPLYFEYGVEPEALRYNPEPPASQCDTAPTPDMDSIRYMYIGGGGQAARWRQCGRCGTRAFSAALTARHPHQRAFDARFLPTCRCGGKWTLRTNV